MSNRTSVRLLYTFTSRWSISLCSKTCTLVQMSHTYVRAFVPGNKLIWVLKKLHMYMTDCIFKMYQRCAHFKFVVSTSKYYTIPFCGCYNVLAIFPLKMMRERYSVTVVPHMNSVCYCSIHSTWPNTLVLTNSESSIHCTNVLVWPHKCQMLTAINAPWPVRVEVLIYSVCLSSKQ